MIKPNFHCTIFHWFTLVFIVCGISNAQDCLEYPDIGGMECVACVPTDWSIDGSTSPDIVPGDGTWPGGGCTLENLSGESPGGGNMVMFVSAGATYQEGMITTVSGLDTGQEYGFGLYWETITINNCGVYTEGALSIELDGEIYEYSGSDDWEFIELCFIPSSSSIDIVLSISTSGNTAIVVDSPGCDMITPCCPLRAEIVEESLEGCPGDDILFDANYDQEEGTVFIEWSSDPSGGIDFLSATDIISPTFNLNQVGDFEGEEYIFYLHIEDDNCEKTLELELEIFPSIIPEFEIYLCEVYENPPLPLESDEGYTGIWTGNFNFDELGGTIQEYTFTLDPGQDNCIEEWVYEIPIDEAVDLSFLIDQSYCVLDDERYRLPDESIENIEGEWNDTRIIPSALGAGVFIFTFQPYNDEFCAFPYELEIEVLEPGELEFNLAPSYCTSNDEFFLPTESLDGIYGEWEVESIDLSAPGNYTFEFTPEEVIDCYLPYQYNFTIGESITNSFSISDSLCRSDSSISLTSLSNEGYLGIWTPQQINFDTISEINFSSTWTPVDQSNQCLSDTTIIFTLLDNQIPVFSIVDTLCKDDLDLSLPTLSENNISGSWDMSIIQPSLLNPGIIHINFSPSISGCISNYSDSIVIIDKEIPSFSFNTLLCANQENILLPSISDNNIPGSWSVNPIVPSDILNSLSVSFYPDPNLMLCADSITVQFNISSLIQPQFMLPDHFCFLEDTFLFPQVSDNGISGQWDISSFVPDDNINEQSFFNHFTPDNTDCYGSMNVNIPVVNFSDINIQLNNPTTCSSSDGQLIVESNNNDLEYSLDNGINWTSDPNFDNLNSGDYLVRVRSNIYNSCEETFSFDLLSPSSPTIISVQQSNITNCTSDDGMVTCLASGSDLEYSIDNGINWQINPEFQNISSGLYQIIVRSNGDILCADSSNFEIIDFPNTVIESSEIQAISDCNLQDAIVSIEATGQNLEYSIDNGTNWQAQNQFLNLDSGSFTVFVRSRDANDCIDSIRLNIDDIDAPIITDIVVTPISDCNAQDAAVEISVATSADVQYSIDNGSSWQSDNTFNNLGAGYYFALVRLVDAPSCIDQKDFEIITIQEPQVLTTELYQASDCLSDDAFVSIETNLVTPEFSIDGGLSWQLSNSFQNLTQGQYQILAREVDMINCNVFYNFEIITPPCPCLELDVDITTKPADCLNAFSGTLQVNSVSGQFTEEAFTINWNNGDIGNVLSNLAEGWYVYQIDYDRNCSLIDSAYVESIDPISFDLLAFDQDCKELGSIVVTNLTGGVGQVQYSLDSINFQDSNVFANLSAEEYQVFVQDLFNCGNSDSVVINDQSNLQLTLDPIEPILLGQSTLLNPLINENTIDNFEWSPLQGILNPGDLIAQVAPIETTEYTLTIYFGDCIEIRSVTVEVIQPKELYIPNVFNPNDVGNNSKFFIQSNFANKTVIDLLSIYDRWGNLVFTNQNIEINNPDSGWDGYINDKKAEIGVYIYVVKYFQNDKENIKHGTITLVR